MTRLAHLKIISIVPVVLSLAACAGFGSQAVDTPGAELREIFSLAGGRTPRLSSSEDDLLLSWQQVNGKTTRLNYARVKDGRVGPTNTAVTGENWFVNYADYARVGDLGEGHWLAAWLERSNNSLIEYQFKVSQSFDQGNNWSKPTTPFDSMPIGQQGFVSALSSGSGALITWVGSHDGRYALYSSHLDRQNRWSPITMVDEDNCSCCHPDMARIGTQAAVVYRDRSRQEIRDIAISFRQGGHWSEPGIVAHDGWLMAGCPVNGPALVSLGEAYAVAWYSAPSEQPRIQLKLVADERSQVIRLDEDKVLGYIDVAAMDSDNVLVGWLSGGSDIQLNLQQVDVKRSRLGPRRKISLPGLRPGFPSLAVSGDRVYIAYESTDDSARLMSLNPDWLD